MRYRIGQWFCCRGFGRVACGSVSDPTILLCARVLFAHAVGRCPRGSGYVCIRVCEWTWGSIGVLTPERSTALPPFVRVFARVYDMSRVRAAGGKCGRSGVAGLLLLS